jgi:hypothetical protein
MNIRRRQFLRLAAGAVAPPAISRVATGMKAALDALVKANAEKWWPIIKELRIKAK